MRIPLKVDVIRDRGALGRVVEDGIVENVYRLQIMNTQEAFRRFRVEVKGIEGIAIASEVVAEVLGATARVIPVRVRVPAGAGKPGTNKIEFKVSAINHDDVAVREKSVFLIPR